MPKTRKKEHGEPKRDVTVTLTESAIAGLDNWARQLGISRSELVTQIGLGKLQIHPDLQALGEFMANC
ncbi:MAG: ribbon-helix-helix protein, CopG family [Leptolyngbya sp. BL-A-14]